MRACPQGSPISAITSALVKCEDMTVEQLQAACAKAAGGGKLATEYAPEYEGDP
jgi:hypothetical protein